jgi:hypothetical protein
LACSELLSWSHHIYSSQKKEMTQWNSPQVIWLSITQYDNGQIEPDLLIYAAENSLEGMVQKILYVGGDINGRNWPSPDDFSRPQDFETPLSIAACRVHEGMIRLLIEAGADLLLDGRSLALENAIDEKHKKIALMLAKELDANNSRYMPSARLIIIFRPVGQDS